MFLFIINKTGASNKRKVIVFATTDEELAYSTLDSLRDEEETRANNAAIAIVEIHNVKVDSTLSLKDKIAKYVEIENKYGFKTGDAIHELFEFDMIIVPMDTITKF